jgi:small-conductance mechanosensitive channel
MSEIPTIKEMNAKRKAFIDEQDNEFDMVRASNKMAVEQRDDLHAIAMKQAAAIIQLQVKLDRIECVVEDGGGSANQMGDLITEILNEKE